jgi:hypothetical protein
VGGWSGGVCVLWCVCAVVVCVWCCNGVCGVVMVCVWCYSGVCMVL